MSITISQLQQYVDMASDAGLLIAGVIGLIFIILIYVEIKKGNEKSNI